MTDLEHRITKLEGQHTVLDLRAPKDPGVIPVLQSEVETLKTQFKSLDAKVDRVLDKLNSLSIKVAAATAVTSAITSGVVAYFLHG